MMRLRIFLITTGTLVLGIYAGGTIRGSLAEAAPWDQESGAPQAVQESNCITCHSVMEGPEADEGVVHDFNLSAHSMAGLDCFDCHGGNPSPPADLEGFDYTPAKGPGTGFRGVPEREDIPEFCGRCHSDAEYMRTFAPQQRVDQERLYFISGHGQALQEGNTNVATCIDCHSTHLILKSSDPRSTVAPQHVPETCERCHADESVMAGSGLSTNVGTDYNSGVHGTALLERGGIGAPACNDCHGNHGAAPPGFSSVSAVCSQCHSANATEFQNSPHGPAFEMMGEPACEVCHGNHAIAPTSDAMLEDDGICSLCHAAGDAGFTVASTILTELRTLERNIASADSILDLAHRKGMEIGEGRYTLRQAENKLVQGRAAVHAFSMDAVKEITDLGVDTARDAFNAGESALQEFARRRVGWEIFLILCVVVVVGMWMLIKRFEGPGGAYPLREPEQT